SRLLEAKDEIETLGTIGLLRPRRELQDEEVVNPVIDGDVRGGRAALGGDHRPPNVLAVALAGAIAAVADIRAVDGKVRDDLTQGPGEAGQCEVTRGAVLLRDAVEPMSEHAQLCRH